MLANKTNSIILFQYPIICKWLSIIIFLLSLLTFFLIKDCENSNISMNSTSIFCGNSINNNGPPHKNSIPDIILTFSGKIAPLKNDGNWIVTIYQVLYKMIVIKQTTL